MKNINTKKMVKFLQVFVFLTAIHLIASYKILFGDILASTSHVIPQAALAEGLIERGHEVTFLVARKFDVISDKAKQIVFPEIPNELQQLANLVNVSSLERISKISKYSEEVCEAVTSSKSVLKVLEEEKYDIAIFSAMFQQCLLAMVRHHQKDIPFIMFFPAFPTSVFTSRVTGFNAWDASYVPNIMVKATEVMDFKTRLINFVMKPISMVAMRYLMLPSNRIIQKKFGAHLDIDTMERDASFLFINSNFEYEYPVPLTPDAVMTGCLQCRPGRPLPEDIRKFMDNYKNEGVIVFSLGSIVSMSTLDTSVIQSFIDAFKEVKQGVIWHSSEPIVGLSQNVLLKKWLPMQDVLADSSTSLIISHGGYNTLQESIYHGVTYLGMAVMGTDSDRSRNVRLAQYRGIGLYFEEDEPVTKDSILEKISLLISNKKFKESALRLSGMLKDQIVSGKDLAVYKTEFAIRHRGSTTYKCHARNLTFVQYYMLDILFTILVLVSALLFTLALVLKFTWFCLKRCCFSKKVKVQ